jgi:hypothetical protein
MGAKVGSHIVVKRADAMNDSSAEILGMVAERHRSMTPEERWLAASSLFETARKIVESSLPSGLTREERRLAVARRLYQNELPEAALIAHAKHVESGTPRCISTPGSSDEARAGVLR